MRSCGLADPPGPSFGNMGPALAGCAPPKPPRSHLLARPQLPQLILLCYLCCLCSPVLGAHRVYCGGNSSMWAGEGRRREPPPARGQGTTWPSSVTAHAFSRRASGSALRPPRTPKRSQRRVDERHHVREPGRRHLWRDRDVRSVDHRVPGEQQRHDKNDRSARGLLVREVTRPGPGCRKRRGRPSVSASA